jgi:hypothetical protein
LPITVKVIALKTPENAPENKQTPTKKPHFTTLTQKTKLYSKTSLIPVSRQSPQHFRLYIMEGVVTAEH